MLKGRYEVLSMKAILKVHNQILIKFLQNFDVPTKFLRKKIL